MIQPVPAAAVLAAHPDVPGLIGALVEGDRVTAIGAAGVRKFGQPEPITPDDLIHLGSCTKAMTATLIGQLIDAGKLALTTTMAEACRDLAPRMHPAMAKVTIADLLRHTSGLPRDVDWRYFDRIGKPLITQRRMVLERVLTAAPEYAPGTRVAYSNVGFVVLGAILEDEDGKPWEELIRSRLFMPLGMSSGGFGPPGTPGLIDQPWGHLYEGAVGETIRDPVTGARRHTRRSPSLTPTQSDNPAVIAPAGMVHCTMSAWGKFVGLYLRAEPRQPEVLSDSTRTLLITPGPVGNYAGGWQRVERSWGGQVMTHGGTNRRWKCTVWASPEKGFAILTAANVGPVQGSKACDELATRIGQSRSGN